MKSLFRMQAKGLMATLIASYDPFRAATIQTPQEDAIDFIKEESERKSRAYQELQTIPANQTVRPEIVRRQMPCNRYN